MSGIESIEVKFVKGVGPSRASLLSRELGIRTVADLLFHYPASYVDRSRMASIRDITDSNTYIQIRGRFVTFKSVGEGAKERLVGLFTDGSSTMEIIWFRRIKAIRDNLRTATEYVIFGKPQLFNGRWNIVHPEIDTVESAQKVQGLRGVYPLTEGLRKRNVSSRTLFTIMQSALKEYAARITDPLPQELVLRLRLMPLRDALTAIHNPVDAMQLRQARFRLKFEELFLLQLNILKDARHRRDRLSGIRLTRIGKYFNDFYAQCMPFELTGAQKRVIREIRDDMASGRQMNRLLQGDVGSGKTLVALLTMLIAIGNGVQTCLMAPTEILAQQHFESIAKMVAPVGINVKLLTGSSTKKERDIIESQLVDGSLHMLIGTHAVIEDNVRFRNLGLAIIDEQHRFGVAQRAKMWSKNGQAPHVLVMTATPIPRTLAMTVYGDLDVSVIDELPPGRKPITTLLRFEEQRLDVYRKVAAELRQGRQAYIVYPLIRENEKLSLKSLEEGYDQVREVFSKFRVAYVHGQMKPAEKEYQMQLFINHDADILVATTVIEVGVNVPNASVMIIENAERFGLSQLHQLRGRVGRGADQSWCILMSKQQVAKPTRERLGIMTSTTDGFKVAEADMRMRGPGDIEGTMQSGIALQLRIANLAADGQIIQMARDEASALLENDPTLSAADHRSLLDALRRSAESNVEWGRIS